MTIKQVTPYLNFNGTAEKAIKLYETALGAKTEDLMRWGDVPGNQCGPGAENHVMHALLHIGDGTIMVSDTPPNVPAPNESNTHVCLDFSDANEMVKKFDALAAGGNVTMPVADTFWNAKFGMLTDAYGIRWMFNCSKTRS